MRRRWQWGAFATVVTLGAGSGTAYVVTRDRPLPQPPPAVRAAPRPPVLAALSSAAGQPTAEAVARRLEPALRDRAFGGHVTGEVVDAATGRELLAREATSALPPASTVKLLTAAAALRALGPDATLSTRVVRAGRTLYLVGGGDVTLRAVAPTRRADYPQTADLASLAAHTVAAVAGTTPVRLCVDASAWAGPPRPAGWNDGYFTAGDVAPLTALEVDEGQVRPGRRPRVADPAGQAGSAFAAALRRAGVTVTGRLCRGTAPASGAVVATVRSAPLAALVQRMLTVSDNDLAEALGRTVARRSGRPATFAGAAAAVAGQVGALGVDVTGLVLHDASGLSRLDRVSARTLVGLVRLAVSPGHPELRPIVEGLPVAGFTGTLADRYRPTRSRGSPAAAGAGVVRAKTGTLAGVNTLAGYVVDADGRLLVFAFLTDRAVGPDATEAALDRLAARLAGCGCH